MKDIVGQGVVCVRGTNVPSLLHLIGTLGGIEREEMFALRVDCDEFSLAQDLYKYSSVCWTFSQKDSVIASLGACMLSPGVISCWMMTSPFWRPVCVVIGKYVKKHIWQYFSNVHRAEALVLEGNYKAVMWLKWLGFTLESTQVSKGMNRENFDLYVWIRR